MVKQLLSSVLTVLGAAALALGVPTAAPVPASRAGVTQLSAATIASYAPYTEFARAAYCPTAIASWGCGAACTAVPNFKVSISGGNGNDLQYYYVGTWAAQKTIVVAHEGTDPTQFLSVLTDVEFVQQPLDTTLFPGAPSSAWVHGGFANAHLDTGAAILAAVKGLLKTTGYTKVATVGHSLGGALAELDALMLRLNLPSSVAVNAVTFGTPRVGNQAYANFFDSKLLGNFVRINHEFDPIPIVPGRGLGFVHPSGEIHMFGDGDAIACPGQDDATDELCTISYVPNIFEADLLDHLGPYQDIYIGTLSC